MTEVKLIIPSKKTQINNFENDLAQEFVENIKEQTDTVTTISIQGHSYFL